MTLAERIAELRTALNGPGRMLAFVKMDPDVLRHLLAVEADAKRHCERHRPGYDARCEACYALYLSNGRTVSCSRGELAAVLAEETKS